jgi:pectate lyase
VSILSCAVALALGCSADTGAPGDAPDSGQTADVRASVPDAAAKAGDVAPVVDAAPVEANDGPTGWASVAGDGLNGTTGGRGGATVTASTLSELQKHAASAGPLVIQVSGTPAEGDINVASDKTLVGLAGAVVRGSIKIKDAQNIIVANLAIVGRNCSDSPSDCGAGSDAVGVRRSHHLWFDHLDISDGSDGNLDLTKKTNYVTVSWCKFWYTNAKRDHRLSNLVGGSDSDDEDKGKLKVTFHHNWWGQHVTSRMPRARHGQMHVFNNLYTASGNSYCIVSAIGASLLVESNVFSGVKSPHRVQQGGKLRAVGNRYVNVSGDKQSTGSAFVPPYSYQLQPTADLAATIKASAGAR